MNEVKARGATIVLIRLGPQFASTANLKRNKMDADAVCPASPFHACSFEAARIQVQRAESAFSESLCAQERESQ